MTEVLNQEQTQTQEPGVTSPEGTEGKDINVNSFTPEVLESFLETQEGRNLLQPHLDRHFSKGLETWKHNNLQKIIDAEVSARMPNETPEAKQLREMTERIAKIEQEKTRSQMKNLGIQLAHEKNLPSGLVDYFIADNDSDTRQRINFLELEFKSAVEKAVTERLKSSATVPAATSSQQNMKATTTVEDLMNMSYSERQRLHSQNPDMFNKLMSQL